MTQRTEAEIRAAEAMRAAGNGEIAGTASDLATVGCGCNEQEADGCTHMRGGHCRRLADNIEGALRSARASADAEIAELRASLAKAEEALEPFASFGISDDGTLSPAALIRDRICDWFGPSDFAAAAATLSDLRKARCP